MPDKRSPSTVTRAVFVAASCIFLALAGYSLWLDRSATAAIAGALSFAFLLLLQLPYLESMEVLTLKVKLRERLSDAEQLTDQLRTTASVSAQLMYVQLAFMNRMGSIPWSRKRKLLAEVDNNLSQLNVEKAKVDEYKRPFLNIVSFDLYMVFKGSLDEILRHHHSEIGKEIQKHTGGKPIQAGDREYEKLLEQQRAYESKHHDFHDVLADTRLANLQQTLGDIVRRYVLTQDERSKLETIQREVASLSEECWASGTITPNAEEYLNKYGRRTTTRLAELNGK